ncbi:hypothetical protein SALBM135S_02922 [Streptomyces alboniger]
MGRARGDSWPIIQEAAKLGIYSLDFYAQQFFDPTGLGIPMATEEIFWGDAGIGLSIMGTGLAAVGVLANGTEEQIGTWIPQMYGDVTDVKVAAFCSSEPDAGSDVAAMRTRAVYDEAKDEWVLNGTKTWATNGGIANVHVVVAVVDPDLGSKGHASFISPATPASPRARSSRSTASAPRTPPRSSWRTYGSPATACSAARTSWASAWHARVSAPGAAASA